MYPSPAIVRLPDDLRVIVRFPDDRAEIVRRPDDLTAWSIATSL